MAGTVNNIGTFSSDDSESIRLVASFQDDSVTNSALYFDMMRLKSTPTCDRASDNKNIISFQDWFQNIGVPKNVTAHQIIESQSVNFDVPIDKLSTQEELRQIKQDMTRDFHMVELPDILQPHKADIEYVRLFDTRDFETHSNILFGASPRDLPAKEGENLIEHLKHLSKSVTLRGNNDKIDFFMSHSWSDSNNKVDALSWFIENFKREKGRYPTLWFDRVCVDQNKVSDDISLLPIHIGACDRMLIIMGKTYMTHLWCIWELFMLFTFCNTELALERIQILCIEDGFDPIEAFRHFEINSAHCYDPNEEFRLRYLMLEVVGERVLKRSIKALKKLKEMGRIITLNEMKPFSTETTDSARQTVISVNDN